MNTKNAPRRNAVGWGIVTLFGVLGVLAPTVFGIDGLSGGFAVMLVGIIVAITGAIATAIYIRLSRKVDHMLMGRDILVHWQYPPEEWRAHVDKEFSEEKSSKRSLFLVVAVISAVVGVAFLIYDPEAGKWVLLTMAGLIALTGILAWSSTARNYRRNQRSQGDVYITRDAVLIGDNVHVWNWLGSRLEKVSQDGVMIEFHYSAPGCRLRYPYVVRVPVPRGEEETARRIVAEAPARLELR